MNKLVRGLQNPFKVLDWIWMKIAPSMISDSTYLKWHYYFNMRRFPNLISPKTYNEKLQWLKINEHNLLYTKMVDKLLVKDLVEKKIGGKHVIKTLGVWETPESIDWNTLPDKFVLKTTQGGGNVGVVVCKNKQKFDKHAAINSLRKGLSLDLYKKSREWPYKNVKPMVFAEEYMEDEFGELRDYKFFCFNGKVKMLFVATERQKREEPFFNFFDENYNPLNLKQGHPVNTIIPEKPKGFEKMVEIAEKLSEGIPHVRIDLYIINGNVYFGEYTFYHFGGVVPFEPNGWDEKIGSWLELPSK